MQDGRVGSSLKGLSENSGARARGIREPLAGNTLGNPVHSSRQFHMSSDQALAHVS
jgi:hypothetical protein